MSAAATAAVAPAIPIVEDVSASDLLKETLKRLGRKEKNLRLVRFGSGPKVGLSKYVREARPHELSPERHLDGGSALRLWTTFNLRGLRLRFVRATDIGETLAYDVFVDSV